MMRVINGESVDVSERFAVERLYATSWLADAKVVAQAIARNQYAAVVTAELDRPREKRRPVRLVHGLVDARGKWHGDVTVLESYDPADHDLKTPKSPPAPAVAGQSLPKGKGRRRLGASKGRR